MPDFPYTRGRGWVNRSEGWTEGDPVADADWFNSVEAAIHQGQDHEKEGGGSSGGGVTAGLFGLSEDYALDYQTAENYALPFGVAARDPGGWFDPATSTFAFEPGFYEMTVWFFGYLSAVPANPAAFSFAMLNEFDGQICRSPRMVVADNTLDEFSVATFEVAEGSSVSGCKIAAPYPQNFDGTAYFDQNPHTRALIKKLA